ncbi:MAG: HNH endonuclease [Clostridia bacterium]|nr:HNH endonuclease [Clostridia bacterium]
MNNKESALFLVMLFGFFAFSVLIYKVVAGIMRKHVFEHSTFLPELNELNSMYSKSFYMYDDTFEMTHHYNSKTQFDKANFNKLLHDYCKVHEDQFNDIIPLAHKNFCLLPEYNEKASNILGGKSYYSSKIMKMLENRIFRESMLFPPTTLILVIHIKYVSPMGRNSYYNRYTYDINGISACLEEIKKESSIEQEKKRQRSMMNDSLRYDIMKRDGFKCVLCGATQNDGAKLHVDHIFPIAKGGKTEPRNLRTLCDRCNLGKKDKYDPDGVN